MSRLLEPTILLGLFALGLWILPKKYSKATMLTGIIISAACTFVGYIGSKGQYIGWSDGFFFVDTGGVTGIQKVFLFVFAFISVGIALYWQDKKDINKYEMAASLVYLASSIGVVLAKDWIAFLIFWELMALATIYMVYCGPGAKAKASAFRYMLYHLLGGNLLLAGIALTLVNGQAADVAQNMWEMAKATNLGYYLILSGMLVNCAMPPLHSWLVDAYPKASVESNLCMASFTTKVTIFAMISLVGKEDWLILFGGIVAVWAAIMALMEDNVRKLLAYHIISQLGMMVCALATGTLAGDAGASLHAAYNILYKGLLLMVAGTIFYATGFERLSQMKGQNLAKQMPIVFVCTIIGSLSIAGVPYSNGFASKALLMEGTSAQAIGTWLLVVAGVGTWLSIVMKINYFAFVYDLIHKDRKTKENNVTRLTIGQLGYFRISAMVLTSIACVVTGIFPNLGYDIVKVYPHHLFSLEHIAQYAGLFIGATVAFALLIKILEPHKGEVLGVDYLYRTYLPKINVLAGSIGKVYEYTDQLAYDFYKSIVEFLYHPKQVIGIENFKRANEDQGETKPLSQTVHVLVFLCIIAMFIVFILE